MTNFIKKNFQDKVEALLADSESLIALTNQPSKQYNGIFQRWDNPIITRDHIPLNWRFDFNESPVRLRIGKEFDTENLGVDHATKDAADNQ